MMDIWSLFPNWMKEQPTVLCVFDKKHFYINDDIGSRVLLKEEIKDWLIRKKHKFYFKIQGSGGNIISIGNNIDVVRPQGVWLSKENATFFKMKWG